MKFKTDEGRVLWNKLENDPNFVQKYYRITSEVSLSPYLYGDCHTEFEFVNDPLFDAWHELTYVEITKDEYDKRDNVL